MKEKNIFDLFDVTIHLYRPQNLSPGVFWGVESDVEVQNDEKLPPEVKTQEKLKC